MDRIAVRPYRSGDAESLVKLFFTSVHELGRIKYNHAQVRAWAPCIPDPVEWEARMRFNETLVAERNANIVGFIELTLGGHLKMLYRSPDAPDCGVTEALHNAIERRAHELGIPRIHTEASLLAESFFLRHGYRLDGREYIQRSGVTLPRALMSKRLRER